MLVFPGEELNVPTEIAGERVRVKLRNTYKDHFYHKLSIDYNGQKCEVPVIDFPISPSIPIPLQSMTGVEPPFVEILFEEATRQVRLKSTKFVPDPDSYKQFSNPKRIMDDWPDQFTQISNLRS